ncbi:hypothetical protein SF1_29310 [Sphingobacterium faecium NBRC 15299]|nr:hypothetical protein SF1_29310 [Sphingobacterium faecium NBRC 15299]
MESGVPMTETESFRFFDVVFTGVLSCENAEKTLSERIRNMVKMCVNDFKIKDKCYFCKKIKLSLTKLVKNK